MNFFPNIKPGGDLNSSYGWKRRKRRSCKCPGAFVSLMSHYRRNITEVKSETSARRHSLAHIFTFTCRPLRHFLWFNSADFKSESCDASADSLLYIHLAEPIKLISIALTFSNTFTRLVVKVTPFCLIPLKVLFFRYCRSLLDFPFICSDATDVGSHPSFAICLARIWEEG